jgi:uncharacterized protein Usg
LQSKTKFEVFYKMKSEAFLLQLFNWRQFNVVDDAYEGSVNSGEDIHSDVIAWTKEAEEINKTLHKHVQSQFLNNPPK